MTLTIGAPSLAAPTLSPHLRVHLVAAAPGLWRVSNVNAQVIGHLQVISTTLGAGYRARRFHSPSRAFRDLGEFWSADDAVECLIFAR